MPGRCKARRRATNGKSFESSFNFPTVTAPPSPYPATTCTATVYLKKNSFPPFLRLLPARFSSTSQPSSLFHLPQPSIDPHHSSSRTVVRLIASSGPRRVVLLADVAQRRRKKPYLPSSLILIKPAQKLPCVVPSSRNPSSSPPSTSSSLINPLLFSAFFWCHISIQFLNSSTFTCHALSRPDLLHNLRSISLPIYRRPINSSKMSNVTLNVDGMTDYQILFAANIFKAMKTTPEVDVSQINQSLLHN